MRHLVSGRKLNRSASHRRAMLSNLAVSILAKERVVTTVAKAKEVRGVVERLITYGKQGDLNARRMAARFVRPYVLVNPEKKDDRQTVLQKLFDDIAPSYKDREGGYTRILKTEERKGDNAPMAIIELVGRSGHNDPVRKRSGAKKKAAKKTTPKTAAPAKAAAATEEPAAPAAVAENVAAE